MKTVDNPNNEIAFAIIGNEIFNLTNLLLFAVFQFYVRFARKIIWAMLYTDLEKKGVKLGLKCDFDTVR